MPKLFFVDDQEDFLPTLEVVVAHTPKLNMERYVGSNKAVERFMTAIKKDPQRPNEHFYILDINMPVPNQLKLEPIWPKEYQGDYQYCGIALAKWLSNQGTPNDHIALCTHWSSERDRHQELLEELELDGVKWISKHEITNLFDQLQDWEPKEGEKASFSIQQEEEEKASFSIQQELKEKKGGETHHG